MGEMADSFNDTMGAYIGPSRLEALRPRSIFCKYCKRGGFRWMQTQKGTWRLYDANGKIHECERGEAPNPYAEQDIL